MFLKLALLSLVFSFEFIKLSHALTFFHGCGNIPHKNGNFTMISRMWKEGINMGVKDRSVAFVCLTNDKNANVTLQYHTDKWNNIMTPSKRYPAGSVLQLGSTFLLKRFEHKHQGGIFKCVAKAHDKEICLLLGALYMSKKEKKVMPILSIWPPPNPLKIKEGKELSIDCNIKDLSRKLKWYKRTNGTDEELDSSLVTNRDIAIDGDNYGLKSVTFMAVTKSDSGTYVCKKHASISGEKVFEKSVDVIVLDKSSKEKGWTKKKDD
eukprot:Seg2670.5 transcript_id=Seg2670.5/GoldUCD/mRNA.D3Y31 product="hypothetical protein" protein_id=Seg2670.5/GoldUCD/D3Y31